jgi:Flp pilus assembly protein protease CpaA
MFEIIVLSVFALIWLIFASVQDLRTRMVSNWISFSLIIFVLGFRFFYSLFNENFAFFYQGLIGLGIFFVLGNLLYYGRMFAGGDAKLMIALGTILPFSETLLMNIKIFILFFILFLFVGAFYGLAWSIFLSFKNFKVFKKEFSKQLNKNKKIIYSSIFSAIILIILGFYEILFFYFGILAFIFPYLYVYAKAIDDSCLVKKIKTNDLEEGDWLYNNLKIGKKFIKANWYGLNKEQIKKIQKKYKEIKVRQGIPFVPVFLISFLILIYIYFQNFELIEILFENFRF